MSISVTAFTQSTFLFPVYALLGSRSMVYATVCFVAVLVFAYLTNPSESSFRAYLTEQSFRRHLTYLDDSSDQDPDASGVHYSPRCAAVNGPQSDSVRSQVHFANRASVSLRTPLHIYHNLVLFTVAFVVPPTEPDAKSSDLDFPVSNLWFIGVFGGWWKGGLLYSWWVDAAVRSKDEEGVSAGVLSVSALDNLDEYDGVSVLPFSSFEAKKARGSPPRLRNPRNELSDGARRALSSRSTTPPPLPATASLPFHNVQQSTCVSAPKLFHPPASNPVMNSTSSLSTSLSKSFDQSPVIVDLLSRISSTRAGVQDLRSQIADFRAHSSHQREALNRELEIHREQKRQEELTRNDLKSRTRSLEDSKRSAESSKRDAERKLKSAETRRDEFARKITHLHSEITELMSRLGDDRDRAENIQSNGIGGDGHGKEGQVYLEEELQKKKTEISVAENVIAALTARAKELEDKVMEGKERQKDIPGQAPRVRLSQESGQDRNLIYHTNLSAGPYDQDGNLSWPPAKPSPIPSVPALDQLPESDPRNVQDGHSPRLMSLSAGLPTARLILSDDLIHPSSPANFAPFDDTTSLAADGEILQSTFLIPSGLINSLTDTIPDTDLSHSFKADSDPFIVQPNRSTTAWRRTSGTDAHETSGDAIPRFVDDSPFEPAMSNRHLDGRVVGHFDSDFHLRVREESNLDQQRATMRPIVPHEQPALDVFASTPNLVDPSRDLEVTSTPRRWFSVKEKKKLNPEAEAFNLPNTRSFFKPTVPTFFDALNPSKSGLVTPVETDNSSRRSIESVAHSSFFSKAFAPSPAERAALGAGRFHASLEKLPSLSDVPGSLHTSPILPHTTPSSGQDPVAVVSGSSFAKSVAWLNSLPRRKPKFSPWDDEEH